MLRALLFACTAMLVGSVSVAAAAGTSAGSIRFDVHYGSQAFKVGEAVHEWSLKKNEYELRLVLEASGLAGLFGLQYEQRSTGVLTPAGLEPQVFVVDQRGKKVDSAHFDWSAGRVSVRREGVERRSGEIRPGDQDVLSLWHQARHVIRAGKPVTLTVATGKSLKRVTLEPAGTELLTLGIGRINALKLRVRAEDGELNIDIWLSPDHELLPVRIRIEDEKGTVLDQRAAHIGPGPVATDPKTKKN